MHLVLKTKTTVKHDNQTVQYKAYVSYGIISARNNEKSPVQHSQQTVTNQ